jgi:hypothetical protein
LDDGFKKRIEHFKLNERFQRICVTGGWGEAGHGTARIKTQLTTSTANVVVYLGRIGEAHASAAIETSKIQRFQIG